MKKILFLCDGDHFPQGAFKFINQISENETITVKGLFLSPVDIEQMIPIGFMPVSEPYVKLKENEKLLVRKSQDKFKRECDKHGIKYQIHPHDGSWDRNLFVKESRFADLVVISEELFCLDALNVQPNYFMEETLRSSECPVMVVPEQFREIERLAVAYDGGKEAMFALKQFVYLFPNYMELPAEFVHIDNDSRKEIPDQALLKEYTKTHFDSLNASRLQFDPKKYFSAWLEDKRNVLLVTGAYSRSALSNMFNKSFADNIIANHSCPIFVAHFC